MFAQKRQRHDCDEDATLIFFQLSSEDKLDVFRAELVSDNGAAEIIRDSVQRLLNTEHCTMFSFV